MATTGTRSAPPAAPLGQPPGPPPGPPLGPPPGAAMGRCLIVTNVFAPMHGGSASVYENLAHFGHGQVSVLAPFCDYISGQELPGWRAYDDTADFTVHRLALLRTRMMPPQSLGPRLVLALRELAIRTRVMLHIARYQRGEAITTVCIGELVAGGWLASACRLLGLRTVIYVHGEEISTVDGYDPDRHRRRACLHNADAVVTVSRFTQDMLVGMMGVLPAKITLIPNGVDLTRFAPRPRREDLMARYQLAGHRVLLTVGRLSARKGMDRVIDSLPALLRDMPDLIYLLVGDGSIRADLQARAEALGVRHAVVFAGAVSGGELADHYALADVFIMANRTMPDGDTEGFGIVFLEANACGIPVIAGSAGGSVDAVTDGVNGLLVDGANPHSIVAGVTRLFADSDLRARLRTQGLAAAARSGWAERAARFLSVCACPAPPPI